MAGEGDGGDTESGETSQHAHIRDLRALRTINRFNNGGGSVAEAKSKSSLRKCATDENSLVALSALSNGVFLERNKISVVIISLVEQLASAYEKDDLRRRQLSKSICLSLVSMGLVQTPFLLEEMEGLRAQYSQAFLRLVRAARANLPPPASCLPALPGPEHYLACRSNLSSENMFHISRYRREFEELELIGGGGFGTVYRAVNRLDRAEYAVKKIFMKISSQATLLKILREVTLLAKVNHPNIVGYRGAWVEPFTGENISSSEDLTPSQSFPASNSADYQGSGLQPNSRELSSQSNSRDRSSQSNSNLLSQSESSCHFMNHVIQSENSSQLSPVAQSDSCHFSRLSNIPPNSSRPPRLPGLSIPRNHCPTPRVTSVQLHEVMGTPPEWSSGVEKVVGRPTLSTTANSNNHNQSGHTSRTSCSRKGRGKFWLGDGDESSTDERKSGGDFSSSSIVFLQQSSDCHQQQIVEFSPGQGSGESIDVNMMMGRVVLYIQMELCNKTLRTWLDERNAELSGADGARSDGKSNSRIFQQLLEATNYLHSRGILHRDIKPRNIFLSGDGGDPLVKLGDLGLAKESSNQGDEKGGGDCTPDTPAELREAVFQQQRNHQARVSSTTGVGTQAYASPEQLNSPKSISSSTDMFSLGIVLFELYQPFSTEMERVRSITRLREAAGSGAVWEGCGESPPLPIREMVSQLTAADPSSRPTAAQLLNAHFNTKKLENLDLEHLTEENRGLREKVKLQEQQIEKQEELLKIQSEELKLLKKRLENCRLVSECDSWSNGLEACLDNR